VGEVAILPAGNVDRIVVDYDSISGGDVAIQRIWLRYNNGYGLSLIRGPGTYSDEGSFEVAIIRWVDGRASMISDPLGWQSEEELVALESDVAALRVETKEIEV
jgi:hypothetical protein